MPDQVLSKAQFANQLSRQPMSDEEILEWQKKHAPLSSLQPTIDFLMGALGLGGEEPTEHERRVERGGFQPSSRGAGELLTAILPAFGTSRFADLIKRVTGGGVEFKAAALKKMEEAIRAGEGTEKLWEPLSRHQRAFGEDPVFRLAKEHSRTIRDLTSKNQGATFNLFRGDLAGTDHFAVSTFPDRTVKLPGAPSETKVNNFIRQNSDLLRDPENSVGTWWDKEKKEFVLDVVKTVPTREQALQLAQQHEQDAIFDLKNLEEIRLSKGEQGKAAADIASGRFELMKPKQPIPSERRMEELIQKFGGTYTGPERRAVPREMLELEHRSPTTGLTELDPARFGSALAGEEKARATDPEFIPRTYFTVKGGKVEPRFRNMPGVYSGEVAKGDIYPIASDPLELVKKAQEQAKGETGRVRTIFETMVRKAGFKGYTDGTSVALFEKLKVQSR